VQGAIAAGANPDSLRAEAAENRQRAVGTQLALAGAGAAAAPAIGTALARGASRTETDVTASSGPVKTRSESPGTEASALAGGPSRTETDVTAGTRFAPVKTRSESSGTEASLEDTPFNQRFLGEELGRKRVGERQDAARETETVESESVALGRDIERFGEAQDDGSAADVLEPDFVVQSRRRTTQQPDTRRPDTKEEQTDVEFQDQGGEEDLLQVSEEAASRTQLKTAQDSSSDFTAPATEPDNTFTLSPQEASIVANRGGDDVSDLAVQGFTEDGDVIVKTRPSSEFKPTNLLQRAQDAVENPNALGIGAGSLVQEKRPEVSDDSLGDLFGDSSTSGGSLPDAAGRGNPERSDLSATTRNRGDTETVSPSNVNSVAPEVSDDSLGDLFGDTSRPGDSLPDPAGRGRPERPDLSAATRNRGDTDTISPSDVTSVAPTVAVGQTQETSTTQNTQTTRPENKQEQTPFNREIQEQPQDQAQGQDTGLDTDLDTTPFAFQTPGETTRQDTPFPGAAFSNPEPTSPTSTTTPNQGSGTPFQVPDFDTPQPREQDTADSEEAVPGEESPGEAQFGLVGASIIQSRGQEVESFELEESQRTETNLLSGFQPSAGGDLI